MFLHVSAQALPRRCGATQRRQKMEVIVLGGDLLKLLAIINVLLAAHAEQQPELLPTMTGVFGQQPVQHGAEGRDSGSGGDEHGVTQRRAQDEIAERPLKRDLRAFVETAEIVRHESILYSIQAEGEVPVFGRW